MSSGHHCASRETYTNNKGFGYHNEHCGHMCYATAWKSVLAWLSHPHAIQMQSVYFIVASLHHTNRGDTSCPVVTTTHTIQSGYALYACISLSRIVTNGNTTSYIQIILMDIHATWSLFSTIDSLKLCVFGITIWLINQLQPLLIVTSLPPNCSLKRYTNYLSSSMSQVQALNLFS